MSTDRPAPQVLETEDIATVQVAPGVELKELTGRTALPDAQTNQGSVAYFRLEPGAASAWSHNLEGEESFFVLRGRGEIWLGNQPHAVKAGSFVVLPPHLVRSMRASQGAVLEYYSITTPAWDEADHVLVEPPAGFSG